MAWAPNFKMTSIATALPRTRFEKIKKYFHLNNNSVQPQKGQSGYDKLYKVRPLLNFIKTKFNEISQEEFQSVDEQMIAYKGNLFSVEIYIYTYYTYILYTYFFFLNQRKK